MFGWIPDVYDDPNNLPKEMPDELKFHIGNETAMVDDRPKRVR